MTLVGAEHKIQTKAGEESLIDPKSNLNLCLLKNKVGAPADLDAWGVEIASTAGPGTMPTFCTELFYSCGFWIDTGFNLQQHSSFTAFYCRCTKTACEPLNESALPAPSKIYSVFSFEYVASEWETDVLLIVKDFHTDIFRQKTTTLLYIWNINCEKMQ